MSHTKAFLTRLRESETLRTGKSVADQLEDVLRKDGWFPPEDGHVNVMGMMVSELPEGWQPLNVIMVIECLKLHEEQIAPGRFPYGLVCRATEGLSLWNAEGMVTWAQRQVINQSDGLDED